MDIVSNYVPSSVMNFLKMNSDNVQVKDKKSKKVMSIESVINKINAGYKVLILLRGLPGSGKSTLAKIILENTIGYNYASMNNHVLSADDFFFSNGTYQYDGSKVSEAHVWNQQRAMNNIRKGYSPIIIDNTNTQMWEMKSYAGMAADYGYYIEILEPTTHWCFNEKELAKRNIHGVSKAKIKDMNERYEKNVTPLKLMIAFHINYKTLRPPQLRQFPPISNSPLTQSSNEIPMTNGCDNAQSNTFVMLGGNAAREEGNLIEFSPPNTSYMPQTVDVQILPNGKYDVVLRDETKQKDTLKEVNPPSFKDIQNAWGVDETALRSWDIVTPLNEDKTERQNAIQIYDSDDEVEMVDVKDASTMTDDRDFYILQNSTACSTFADIKMLTTCNRDINRNAHPRFQGIPKKLMLDKSCLTEDLSENQNIHIEQLSKIFPNISVKNIKFWYNRCNCDMDCTIELLLAEKEELINVLTDEDEEESFVQQRQETATCQEKISSICIDSDSSDSANASPPNPSSPKSNKHKRKHPISSSDESEELRKCIESKVSFGDEHYSEKLLKIKQNYNQKYAPCMPSTSTSKPQPIELQEPFVKPSVASSSDNNFVQQKVANTLNNLSTQSSVSSMLTSSSSSESFIEAQLDEILDDTGKLEIDDMEPEVTTKQEQNENVELIELNLGEHFVKQLENHFADPNLLYPKGFQPVIQLPIALARQLYTFYIESVYQQMEAQNDVMETLVKEDEEFARKLQEEDEKEVSSKESVLQPVIPEVPTVLPEIMREQKQLSKWQKEAEKWKEFTPDTLAAKLTREKLFSVFPSLDKDTLIEILYAHDNVYKDTVETLLASTGMEQVNGNIDNIKNPPIEKTILNEMWEAHKSCVNKESPTEGAYAARDYREEANKYLKKRAELYEKAQKHYLNGMKEVAQFYSALASKQTKYYEYANSLAAAAFVDEHSRRLQDFNTLDLHFLYVKEAVPTLDLFLDRSINLLRLSTTKTIEILQIITGRGKNSKHGVAKIRPVIQSRLKQRGIAYQSLNPGLLKVKITKTTKLTDEL